MEALCVCLWVWVCVRLVENNVGYRLDSRTIFMLLLTLIRAESPRLAVAGCVCQCRGPRVCALCNEDGNDHHCHPHGDRPVNPCAASG